MKADRIRDLQSQLTPLIAAELTDNAKAIQATRKSLEDLLATGVLNQHQTNSIRDSIHRLRGAMNGVVIAAEAMNVKIDLEPKAETQAEPEAETAPEAPKTEKVVELPHAAAA